MASSANSGSPNLHSLFSCQSACLARVRKQKSTTRPLLVNGKRIPVTARSEQQTCSEHSPREPVTYCGAPQNVNSSFSFPGRSPVPAASALPVNDLRATRSGWPAHGLLSSNRRTASGTETRITDPELTYPWPTSPIPAASGSRARRGAETPPSSRSPAKNASASADPRSCRPYAIRIPEVPRAGAQL